MMAFFGFVLFAAAMAAALGVIFATVAPQWRRIAALASGGAEGGFKPLGELARAERRIAVRGRGVTRSAVSAPARAAA